MTLDTLKEDLERNRAAIPADAPQWAKDLWAFQEAVIEEMMDMDDAVCDLVERAADILQPETAELFATIISYGFAMVAQLTKRLKRGNPEDTKVARDLVQIKAALQNAVVVLKAIAAVRDPDEAEADEEPAQPADPEAKPEPTLTSVPESPDAAG